MASLSTINKIISSSIVTVPFVFCSLFFGLVSMFDGCFSIFVFMLFGIISFIIFFVPAYRIFSKKNFCKFVTILLQGMFFVFIWSFMMLKLSGLWKRAFDDLLVLYLLGIGVAVFVCLMYVVKYFSQGFDTRGKSIDGPSIKNKIISSSIFAVPFVILAVSFGGSGFFVYFKGVGASVIALILLGHGILGFIVSFVPAYLILSNKSLCQFLAIVFNGIYFISIWFLIDSFATFSSFDLNDGNVIHDLWWSNCFKNESFSYVLREIILGSRSSCLHFTFVGCLILFVCMMYIVKHFSRGLEAEGI